MADTSERAAEVRGWAWFAITTSVFSLLVWLVAPAWQGPRYSVLKHTISDSYAVTAPHGAWVAASLTLSGAGVVVFALRSVRPVLRPGGRAATAGSILLAASILGVGDLFAPFEREACRLADPGCRPADQLANLGGTLDGILSAVGLVLFVVAGFLLASAMTGTPGWEARARPTRQVSVAVLVLIVLTVLGGGLDLGGLFERLLAAAAAAGVVLLALGVLSRTKEVRPGRG